MDTSLLKRELSELVHRLGWSDTFSHLADKARDEGESPPPRGRGLKRRWLPDLQSMPKVAPSAGAWIETRLSARSWYGQAVAPSAGAWIETCCASVGCDNRSSRPLRGGVD